MTDTCQQRMVITARHRRTVPPTMCLVTVEDSVAPCPSCGNTDLDAWADDGESDSSDWWECRVCGCSGAFLDVDTRKDTTPNGLTVDLSTPVLVHPMETL